MRKIKLTVIIILISLILISYFIINRNNNNNNKIITIGATSFPHIEIINIAKSLIEKDGYILRIKEFSDYTLINAALEEKSLDANFFQHEQFLNTDIKNHNYKLMNIASIIVEPMGMYSRKIKNLNQIKEKDIIVIPNDESNCSRALFLLQKNNLIKLRNNITSASTRDIVTNIKNIKFIEVNAAIVATMLDDPKIVAGVINTNFAIVANLNPLKDTVIIEDRNSPYKNILVVRNKDKDKHFVKVLIKAFTSKKVKKYIQDKLSNKGILCAFK